MFTQNTCLLKIWSKYVKWSRPQRATDLQTYKYGFPNILFLGSGDLKMDIYNKNSKSIVVVSSL